MGAGSSSIAAAEEGGCSSPSKMMVVGLGDMPESCVASVLIYLDPPEICKLARLNQAFRGASSADFIWESKLPSNYKYLMEKIFGQIPANLSMKEIYAKLCRPNRFGDGTKEIWLDKRTAQLCMSISAKALTITGIDDRRYWKHLPTEESRFNSIAYLQQIWWFEVDGEVELCFPAGTYSLFYRIQLGRAAKRFGRRVCNPEHIHGWDLKPVRFQLQTSDGQHAMSHCYLDEPGNWVNYHVGDFVVENPNTPTKIKFSVTQIDCTHTKGGLCLDSVLIYPSELRDRLKR
ncbi:F-box protein PP2-A13-like [Papaver somniferum]|uniref:F-box protein PP2-A13-like n=1 Tax=Papaver somniferum TaxID=3469 RepID=UPI000E6F8DE5|nr:F-box protein PP2-A13-like [Papaver somniferum]